MGTLRQVVTETIDSLGRPFDNMLYARVRSALMNECVLWIRRSINQRGLEDDFEQSYVAELEFVDSADNPIKISNIRILRSVNIGFSFHYTMPSWILFFKPYMTIIMFYICNSIKIYISLFGYITNCLICII